MAASDTSAQSNIDIIRKAFDAFNRKDWDACITLMSDDMIMNLPGADSQMRGKETWMQGVEAFTSGFPDVEARIEDIFASEDRVAVRLTFRGTHLGPFMDVQPSGKSVEYTSIEIYRVSDGKVAEEWVCPDMATLMRQIGT